MPGLSDFFTNADNAPALITASSSLASGLFGNAANEDLYAQGVENAKKKALFDLQLDAIRQKYGLGIQGPDPYEPLTSAYNSMSSLSGAAAQNKQRAIDSASTGISNALRTRG